MSQTNSWTVMSEAPTARNILIKYRYAGAICVGEGWWNEQAKTWDTYHSPMVMAIAWMDLPA